jgi:hypothetical protein
MLLRLTLAFVLSLLVPSLAFAQDPGPAPQAAPFTDTERAKFSRLQLLGEIERLQKEVVIWRQMALEALVKLGPYETAQTQKEHRQELLGLVEEFEKARPGFTFDLKTGMFIPKVDAPKAK